MGKVIFLGKELCRLYLRDDAMMALQPQLVRSLSAQPILPEICSNLIKLPALVRRNPWSIAFSIHTNISRYFNEPLFYGMESGDDNDSLL